MIWSSLVYIVLPKEKDTSRNFLCQILAGAKSHIRIDQAIHLQVPHY